MVKIGIIKETKTPVDNRVALTPKEIINIQEKYPQAQFFVQKSDIRAYTDEEYEKCGIPVVDSLEECDVLFGIKEAKLESLLPNKHYFFFGHIAKEQPYNRPLIKKMMELGITFSDYEYLVNEGGERLCAFGWWAGVVGTYNTIRAYGLRTNKFELEKPGLDFTLEKLISNLKEVRHLCNTSIIVTGNGKVSQGAQYILQQMEAQELSPETFMNRANCDTLVYTVLQAKDLVKHKDGKEYDAAFGGLVHGQDTAPVRYMLYDGTVYAFDGEALLANTIFAQFGIEKKEIALR